jgi:hypothetical protein
MLNIWDISSLNGCHLRLLASNDGSLNCAWPPVCLQVISRDTERVVITSVFVSLLLLYLPEFFLLGHFREKLCPNALSHIEGHTHPRKYKQRYESATELFHSSSPKEVSNS